MDHLYAKKSLTELMQEGMKAELLKRKKVQFLSYYNPLHNSVLLREDIGKFVDAKLWFPTQVHFT